ncbi:hypothetical protein ALT_0102 [Aspergillus lentulus]|uniref:Uncharacterized protein n=1 Tax=Aspergillus lentulus TaxID=293939 RepID=A0AAN4PBC7_ASPLE|nr:hypothetical protein CNMCM6069_009611 [Aspergillus lentulus]KAF4182050.1 hypothetical protein CNMCM7927_000193 [Aspergillus lentulus]GAQ02781.1 hypothetical protein ALT_0102 [Aspergillus lentulus]GFF55824.1 hypothetical protein IFM62136_02953 [Aspergillus lentulus]
MRERSNSWKAAQQKKKREARRKLREVRGYNPDAHREKDAERATGRASKKAKEVYRKHARKYGEFLMEVKNMHEGFRLEEGYPAPTLERLKQYMRWFIESTKDRLDPDGRPTMKSTQPRRKFRSRLFPDWQRIPECDAADLYNKDLVQDRTNKAIKRQKFDLKLCDFERAMTALWETDDEQGLVLSHLDQIRNSSEVSVMRTFNLSYSVLSMPLGDLDFDLNIDLINSGPRTT